VETLYEISAEAQNNRFEIWQRIATDSADLANRIDDEFHALFASLARRPGQGHARKDLTRRPVLFFPLYSFPVAITLPPYRFRPISSAEITGAVIVINNPNTVTIAATQNVRCNASANGARPTCQFKNAPIAPTPILPPIDREN
jgi:plasmid stabilization system protein ParE